MKTRKLEEKREYYLYFKDSLSKLIVVKKVIKDTQGSIKEYKIFLCGSEEIVTILPESFSYAIPTLTNTEFFIMYTQFKNCVDKSKISYDLEFAKQLYLKILSTIQTRMTTTYGNGKFEDFDTKRLSSFLTFNLEKFEDCL